MLSKYRARQCPNCHYKLPVHTSVRGNGAARRRLRRPKLRLIVGTQESGTLIGIGQRHSDTMDVRISPADYARHLRAIGQDLENLHLTTFNLEYVGDAYLVWVRSDEQTENNNPLFRISKNRLQNLWRNKMPPRTLGHEEPSPLSTTQTGKRLRYAIPELDQIEREQRA